MKAASASSARYILGRGCDPQRARFAEKTWGPKIGATIHVVTSDEELMERLKSGTQYEGNLEERKRERERRIRNQETQRYNVVQFESRE
jgi:hypothetical protein